MIATVSQISDKTYISIITAVVITRFVVSAGFTVVALYALRPPQLTRIEYMHRSFNATLIGFIYIYFINLIIYFIQQPQGVIPPSVFAGTLIAGIVISVPIAILARKSRDRLEHLYTQSHEVKSVSDNPTQFVDDAVDEKLAKVRKQR